MLFFSPLEFASIAVCAILLGVVLQVGIGSYGASFGVSFAVHKGDLSEEESVGSDDEE